MVTNMALSTSRMFWKPDRDISQHPASFTFLPSDHHTLGLATLWHLLWYNVISMASSDTTMLAPARIFQAA
jgi:hypothetical protein